MTDLSYMYWLATTPGITGPFAVQLERRYGAKELWEMDRQSLRALSWPGPEHIEKIIFSRNEERIQAEIYKLKHEGIWLLGLGCPGYPELLAGIPDPPAILYGRGRMPAQELPRIAVIGARRCSDYGLRITKKLAKGLTESGMVIVSGMAAGIDAQAHITALDTCGSMEGGAEGHSSVIAVLGSGVDVCYPKSNERLYERLIAEGCILSEYPPGTKPATYTFPQRNRIISGLSLGVTVVEATDRSGTSITVNKALAQGREVFVVPGNVDSIFSVGTNRLIKYGAIPITDYSDILWALRRELGYTTEDLKNETSDGEYNILNKNVQSLAGDEAELYKLITAEPADVSYLVAATGLAAQDVMFTLTKLELKMLIRSSPGQKYVRT